MLVLLVLLALQALLEDSFEEVLLSLLVHLPPHDFVLFEPLVMLLALVFAVLDVFFSLLTLLVFFVFLPNINSPFYVSTWQRPSKRSPAIILR